MTNVAKFDFGESLSEKIIHSLLTKKDYLLKIESGLDMNYFELEAHQWIVTQIKKYFNLYKNTPTTDFLNTELKKFRTQSENNKVLAKQVSAILKNLYNEFVDEGDSEYAESEFTEFCKKQAHINVAELIPDLIQDGRFEEIERLVKMANRVGVTPLIGHFLKEQTDEIFREEQATIVPFQIQELNDLFPDGGILGGSVVINLGQPAGGKSWFGVDWATFLAYLGYDVVYFNLESQFRHVARRFYARINQIELSEVKYNRTKIEESLNSLEGNIVIVDLKKEQKTVDYIYSYLEALNESRGIKPRLVIIDYVNLLKHKNSKDELVGQQKTWEDVTDLAKEGDFVVYSPSPVNRGGFGDKVLTGDKIGGAIKAIYDTDLILSFSTHNILHVIKNKNGKGNGTSYEMDYNSGTGVFKCIGEYFEENDSSGTTKKSIKDRISSIGGRK